MLTIILGPGLILFFDEINGGNFDLFCRIKTGIQDSSVASNPISRDFNRRKFAPEVLGFFSLFKKYLGENSLD
jgi:hypothetical protein